MINLAGTITGEASLLVGDPAFSRFPSYVVYSIVIGLVNSRISYRIVIYMCELSQVLLFSAVTRLTIREIYTSIYIH